MNSNVLEKTIQTTNSAATEAVGRAIAQQLRGGEVIELRSDLGGGKTTFTRGLVAGLQSTEPVASPTFTISREYTAGRLRVYHFDFYRLAEAGIVADELAEVVGDKQAVVVVEWGEIVEDVLPKQRLTVQITATGENERTILLTCPETLLYLMEAV
jgi:tRNA threonylcarbamoyladenosine biosynthesis protein TsaE